MGGGARIMRTWEPGGAATIMVVPGGWPAPPADPAMGARLPIVMVLPGTPAGKPPGGAAIRSRIVCMGMAVPGAPAAVSRGGPDSLGVTTIPGGRLGTRYVTLGWPTIGWFRRIGCPIGEPATVPADDMVVACVNTIVDPATDTLEVVWPDDGFTWGRGFPKDTQLWRIMANLIACTRGQVQEK